MINQLISLNKSIKQLKLVFILLSCVSFGSLFVSAQTAPILTLTLNKEWFEPGETAQFIIAGNQNDSVFLDIFYNDAVVESFSANITETEPVAIYWEVGSHASNGTYTVLTYYSSINASVLNDTASFGVRRDDIVIPRENWSYLLLNITFRYKSRDLESWFVNVTNISTEEQAKYTTEPGATRIVISYTSVHIDEMIKVKDGQAISMIAETKDGLFLGEILFAADLYDNTISIKAIKQENEDYMLGIGFVLVGAFGSFQVIRYVQKQVRDKNEFKLGPKKKDDPWKLPEIDHLLD